MYFNCSTFVFNYAIHCLLTFFNVICFKFDLIWCLFRRPQLVFDSASSRVGLPTFLLEVFAFLAIYCLTSKWRR